MPRQHPVHDYPARKARGGIIALRRPWQRAVFVGGLIGCVSLVFLIAVLG
jgi:hypothetical protein